MVRMLIWLRQLGVDYSKNKSCRPDRLKNNSFLFYLFLLTPPLFAIGNQSIKLTKQKVDFFYSQWEHRSTLNDGDESPHLHFKNRIDLKWKSLMQSKIQQGYTHLFAPEWVELKLELEHKEGRLGPHPYQSYQIVLSKANINVDSKWDRTRINFGINQLAISNNPQIDLNPDNLHNPTHEITGFSRDLGVWIKGPILPYADLHLSLSSGSPLTTPFLVVTKNPNIQTNPVRKKWLYPEYHKTWLVSARITNPSFSHYPWGLFLINGSVLPSSTVPINTIQVVGADVTWKQRELTKIINMLAWAKHTSDSLTYTSLHWINSFEYYLRNSWVLGASESMKINQNVPEWFSLDLRGKLAWMPSIHTSLNAQPFAKLSSQDSQRDFGISVQFVTGLGTKY